MRAVLTLLLLVFLNQIHATESMVIHLGPRDTTFQVSLPANVTTGYQWTVKHYDHHLLTLVSSQYTPSAPASGGLMGSGGVMLYRFKLNPAAETPKKTELIFCYARPWEKSGGSLRTVAVKFSEK